MGATYQAKCLKCGNEFEANSGGGFFFHLLHCDKCGREKTIPFKNLGELQMAFMKGMDFACGSGSDVFDAKTREYQGEPIDVEEYEAKVEEIAGKCRCRGLYKLQAKIRCPKCRSDEIEEEHTLIMYD
jgi:Zn finger protein HypA/HybF involved in hydrogenase expression